MFAFVICCVFVSLLVHMCLQLFQSEVAKPFLDVCELPAVVENGRSIEHAEIKFIFKSLTINHVLRTMSSVKDSFT